MQNIYQTWTEFNKVQNHVLQSSPASNLLDSVEKSVELWKSAPYPKGEDWKYVKFDNLPTTHFRWVQDDQANKQLPDENFYTFEINNFKTPQKFEKLALPKGLELISELEATDKKLPPLQTTNPFEIFSRSFYGLGFYLKINKDFDADKPIRMVFNLDALTEKDLFIQQNIHISVEPEATAQIFVEVNGQAFSGLSNLCFDVKCAERSEVEIYSKESGGAQSYFVYNLSSQVQAEASFKSFDLTLPSKWSRHNVSCDLREKGAAGQLKGAYLNDGDNFIDHHTTISHTVGDTESLEDYRGILTDQAQAVFNGKVYIAEKARGSNSEQINKNLMLSKKAEVDTKPELQIYNDDVKAAHGATVGQIDEEQRFYLQSRGYSSRQAGRVLAKAFVFGLLDDADDKVKDFYLPEMAQILDGMEEGQ